VTWPEANRRACRGEAPDTLERRVLAGDEAEQEELLPSGPRRTARAPREQSLISEENIRTSFEGVEERLHPQAVARKEESRLVVPDGEREHPIQPDRGWPAPFGIHPKDHPVSVSLSNVEPRATSSERSSR
jgi:hypothetical protein